MNIFRSKGKVSMAALVLANLTPLAGVFFAGWDAGAIVLLYWAENLIVGFYNVLKLALVKTDDSIRPEMGMSAIPFFCVHYGFFCFGHGIFVLLLVSMTKGEPDLSRLGHLFAQILWPLLGLFVSHGVSFVENTLIRQEYKSITARQQLWQPYGRIALLHVGILLAMFVFMPLGPSFGLLASLIVLKIGADIYLHARTHRQVGTAEAEAEAIEAP